MTAQTPIAAQPLCYVSHLREKKSYVLGTELVATPINTYNTYGFNLSLQSMNRYLLIYSPMFFMDKAYQNLLEYYRRHNPSFTEKKELNKIKTQFRKYFGSFLYESSDYSTMLDFFDATGEQWSEITKPMPLVVFNVMSKYIPDSAKCHKFSELVSSYCWINFTDKIYSNLAENKHYMDHDKYELTTRNTFSSYLLDLMGGHQELVNGEWRIDERSRAIFSEIGDAISTFGILIYRHLLSILNQYKNKQL